MLVSMVSGYVGDVFFDIIGAMSNPVKQFLEFCGRLMEQHLSMGHRNSIIVYVFLAEVCSYAICAISINTTVRMQASSGKGLCSWIK